MFKTDRADVIMWMLR